MVILSLDEAIGLRHAPPASAKRPAAYEALLAIGARIRTRFRKADDFDKLTPTERCIYRLVIEMDSEIANGGMDQYLRNASGDRAQESLADLQAVGAHGTLKVLQAAADWFPEKSIPSDADVRFEQLSEMEEAHEDAFEQRMATLSRDYRRASSELYERLMDYVEAHRSDLLEPGAAN